MNRRSFLSMLGLAAAAEAIPFNRVWSFPSKIRPANLQESITFSAFREVEEADSKVQKLIFTPTSFRNLVTIYYDPRVLKRFNQDRLLLEKWYEPT